nr:carcinoembryonic antigen-related cell adhesion molecule 7-like isoform X4 [Caretta caretta]
MGRLSGSWDPPAWGGPWKGLLLAASVLGSCLQPAPAQTPVTIVLTPPSPAVGGGVSLAPQNPPQDLRTCSWFRSATADENTRILTYYPGTPPVQTPGPAHTGRETAGPDCALHIAGLRLNDTGSYMVQIQSPTSPGLATVHLPVSEMLPKPMVTPNQTQVLENGNFTLTCNSSPHTDTLLWLRDGASLAPSDRLGLSPDNRTLTVSGVTRGDAGAYQCEVRNPISTERSEPSNVTVAYSNSPPGLSPGAIAGIVIGSLAGAALIGGLLYFLLCKTGGGPKQRPSVGGQAAPAHNQGVGDNKPTLGDENIQYSTLAFTAGDQKPPPGSQPRPESGTVYSEIRKK